MFPDREIAELPESTATGMAGELLDIPGRRIADIGCGLGRFTIFLASEGGFVTGLDPDRTRIQAAREAALGHDPAVHFMIGVAERLPFADGSVDISIFHNSLHHVPVEGIATALAEASRVLRPGGILYVSEPVAQGSKFEVQRIWNDETDVRSRAYRELSRAETWDLEAQQETFYGNPDRFRDFEAYVADRRAQGAMHAAAIDRHADILRQRFETHGRRDGDTIVLDGAVRLNLFRKRG